MLGASSTPVAYCYPYMKPCTPYQLTGGSLALPPYATVVVTAHASSPLVPPPAAKELAVIASQYPFDIPTFKPLRLTFPEGIKLLQVGRGGAGQGGSCGATAMVQ